MLAGVGIGAAPGAAAGAAGGGAAGAGVGFGVALLLGEAFVISFLILQGATVVEKLTKLWTAEQTDEEKERDYSQLADSLIGIGVTLVLILIGWIASKLASNILGAIEGKFPAFSRFLKGARSVRGGNGGGESDQGKGGGRKRTPPRDWPQDAVDIAKVEDAFKDPSKLSELTPEERATAADYYRRKAVEIEESQTRRGNPELGKQQRAFNEARADYLLKGSDKPFPTFPEWKAANFPSGKGSGGGDQGAGNGQDQTSPGSSTPDRPRSCFVAGTLVSTPAGPRPIEVLSSGETVSSFDPASGEVLVQRVQHMFSPERTIRPGDPRRLGHSDMQPRTPVSGHRTRMARGKRSRAGDLLTSLALQSVPVIAVRRLEGTVPVFNIEVDRLHTYCVSALGILVQ